MLGPLHHSRRLVVCELRLQCQLRNLRLGPTYFRTEATSIEEDLPCPIVIPCATAHRNVPLRTCNVPLQGTLAPPLSSPSRLSTDIVDRQLRSLSSLSAEKYPESDTASGASDGTLETGTSSDVPSWNPDVPLGSCDVRLRGLFDARVGRGASWSAGRRSQCTEWAPRALRDQRPVKFWPQCTQAHVGIRFFTQGKK